MPTYGVLGLIGLSVLGSVKNKKMFVSLVSSGGWGADAIAALRISLAANASLRMRGPVDVREIEAEK